MGFAVELAGGVMRRYGLSAFIDAGGAFRVGPRSAGAVPGPAAYGRGGTEPTVTDANLLLGRLAADRFLGGDMGLDVNAADFYVGISAGGIIATARTLGQTLGAALVALYSGKA